MFAEFRKKKIKLKGNPQKEMINTRIQFDDTETCSDKNQQSPLVLRGNQQNCKSASKSDIRDGGLQGNNKNDQTGQHSKSCRHENYIININTCV